MGKCFHTRYNISKLVWSMCITLAMMVNDLQIARITWTNHCHPLTMLLRCWVICARWKTKTESHNNSQQPRYHLRQFWSRQRSGFNLADFRFINFSGFALSLHLEDQPAPTNSPTFETRKTLFQFTRTLTSLRLRFDSWCGI